MAQKIAVAVLLAALAGIGFLTLVAMPYFLDREIHRLGEWLTWRPLFLLLGVGLIALAAVTLSLSVSLQGNPQRRNTAALILVTLGLVTLIMLGVDVYVDPTSDESKASVAQIWGGVAVGSSVLIGSLVAWRTLQVTRRRLELDVESGLDESFRVAIEQIGATHEGDLSPNIEIRLGGIYTLERIAKSWIERADYDRYTSVIEVLTAYIRRNQGPKTNIQGHPREDMDAILDAIARSLILLPAHVRATLRSPNLRGANFQRTEVTRRNFDFADLTRADFREANLSRASFRSASLAGAQLGGAFLYLANLECADLSSAVLYNAHLRSAILKRANLTGAYIHAADLVRANLKGAILQSANLRSAILRAADLRGADLVDADLRAADLRGADLHNAELLGARMFGADLRGATGLTVQDLLQARDVVPELIPDDLRASYLLQRQQQDVVIPNVASVMACALLESMVV